MNYRTLIYIVLFAILGTACDAQPGAEKSAFIVRHPEQMQDYWYSGKAELNHFKLEQSRYGEIRKGEAVLIYVTEDFLLDKQVKKEFGDGNSTSVLKLNSVKKFITGIYDYSIMTSTFTPIEYHEHPATLKSTFSSQDWCGQSFSQMNLRDRKLNYDIQSYFQNEGDTIVNFPATYVEEDIWTRARLEPQMLPLGKFEMVPSQEYIRLNHKELKAYSAVATLFLQINDSKENREFYIYKLEFPDLDRVLTLHIQSSFPYKITSWEEVLNAKNPAKKTTTKGSLTKTQMRAYWQEHGVKDEALRDSLGLRYKID